MLRKIFTNKTVDFLNNNLFKGEQILNYINTYEQEMKDVESIVNYNKNKLEERVIPYIEDFCQLIHSKKFEDLFLINSNLYEPNAVKDKNFNLKFKFKKGEIDFLYNIEYANPFSIIEYLQSFENHITFISKEGYKITYFYEEKAQTKYSSTDHKTYHGFNFYYKEMEPVFIKVEDLKCFSKNMYANFYKFCEKLHENKIRIKQNEIMQKQYDALNELEGLK